MNMACIRLLQIRDESQERGLSAARRTDEGDELAFLDLQIHVGERIDRAVRSLIGKRKATDVDNRSVTRPYSRFSVGSDGREAPAMFPEIVCCAL
jgi:hypothetical protein